MSPMHFTAAEHCCWTVGWLAGGLDSKGTVNFTSMNAGSTQCGVGRVEGVQPFWLKFSQEFKLGCCFSRHILTLWLVLYRSELNVLNVGLVETLVK